MQVITNIYTHSHTHTHTYRTVTTSGATNHKTHGSDHTADFESRNRFICANHMRAEPWGPVRTDHGSSTIRCTPSYYKNYLETAKGLCEAFKQAMASWAA